ncbi:MAG: T9SS type A sorting domain-containing protein [Candidatus Cloacimonetes bacterium]|nr:T9SS type A sorting domain-containing protein [Candidatus Cloacimonadota bacterium]
MKKIILFLLLVTLSQLFAQSSPQIWNNIRHSSYNTDNEMTIRCETIDMEMLQTEFWYRNNSSTWNMLEMNLYENLTYETVFPYSNTHTNLCRFRSETDTLVMMMPAFLETDPIPDNAETLGFIAEDPTGDCLSENEAMDITNSYFGFSDNKFFVGIENVSGEYPTYSGFPIPNEFYFYIGGLINMETVLQDTVMYGLVYANIPMFVQSGMYKISGGTFDEESIEQIGDISSEIVDDVLIMSCNIDDLVNDADFGDWPNMSNSLGYQVITNVVDIGMNFGLADMSKPSIQTFTQHIIEPFENSVPELSNISVQIVGMNTIISVDYLDGNGNFPLNAQCTIHHENPELDETIPLHPTTMDYTQTVQFIAEVNDVNWNDILISFSDNNEDFVEVTIYEVTTADGDVIANSAITLSNYPNPFNPETTISFEFSNEQNQQYEQAKIEIYNSKGQKIRELRITNYEVGMNKVIWKGDDYSGKTVSSGVYLYKLIIEGKSAASKKCLLMK